MTNELFRDYLDGRIKVQEPLKPMALTEWQVEYLAQVLGILIDDARDISNKIFNLPDLSPPKPAFLLTKRRAALAAKDARGHGPASSDSWRGRELSTKYRST